MEGVSYRKKHLGTCSNLNVSVCRSKITLGSELVLVRVVDSIKVVGKQEHVRLVDKIHRKDIDLEGPISLLFQVPSGPKES